MGVISDQARSPGDVMRRLAELERAVEQLRNARRLENAAVGSGGLRVHSGGSVRIQDGGHLDVSGDADFSGDTSIGGDLDVSGGAEFSGDTTIGGNAAITGTLSLPAGIIDNEALAQPIIFRTDFANSSGSAMNIRNTETTVASFAIPCPPGFSSCVVQAMAHAGVVNPTSNDSSCACRVYIDPPGNLEMQWGPRRYQSVPAGRDGAVFSMLWQRFDGLPGSGSFEYSVAMINTGSDWGSTPGAATVEGVILFTR